MQYRLLGTVASRLPPCLSSTSTCPLSFIKHSARQTTAAVRRHVFAEPRDRPLHTLQTREIAPSALMKRQHQSVRNNSLYAKEHGQQQRQSDGYQQRRQYHSHSSSHGETNKNSNSHQGQHSTWMVRVAVVGGAVVFLYTRQHTGAPFTAYNFCEAAYAVRPEASKRLKILHDQATKVSRGMRGVEEEIGEQEKAAANAAAEEEAMAADGEALKKAAASGTLVSHIIRLLAPECWLFLGVALTAVGAAVVNLWTPVVTGDLINVIARSVKLVAAMDESVLEALRSPARKLLALFVANGLLTFAHTTLVSILGERIGMRLHLQALGTLLSHDLAFFDSAQSASLAFRVSVDIAEFQSTFKKMITQGLKSATLTAGVAWQLLRLSPHLTFTLVSTMPAVYVALAYYGRFLRRVRKAAREWDTISTGISGEAIGNIRTVRALGAETAELELYREARNEASACSNRFGLHMGAFRGLTNTAIGATVLLVLYNGGRLVSNGSMSPGDLMAFMIATQHAQKALDSLGGLMGQTVRAKSAIARVLEVVNLVPTVPCGGGVKLPATQGHIRFMDVDFAYPSRPDAPVLERFNLDIPAGQVVALCGRSGSGKSTVAALLERLYDPSGGEIWLDACPLKRLDPAWHRSQIGYIPQDPALFSTSIRENLRLASPSATDAEIEDACRQANAHDFVTAFPDGYDTIVGERGTLLSGGQKQRLSIARAILRNPRILILDEATSSLDAQSERMVQAALERLMVGRTVLVIAHRLTTIRNADRIVVMASDVPGHIVEQGSHDELMSRRGAYYRLYNDATTHSDDILGG